MKAIIKLVLMGVAVLISAYIIPDNYVYVDGFLTAVVVAVILSVVNFIIKPIVTILTLPINILTLGLFTFVINAGMVLLVSNIVPGFYVAGLLAALLFSVLLSIIRGFLDKISD
jgi:putative membrane protein